VSHDLKCALLCDRVIVMRRAESSNRVIRRVLGDPQDAIQRTADGRSRIRPLPLDCHARNRRLWPAG